MFSHASVCPTEGVGGLARYALLGEGLTNYPPPPTTAWKGKWVKRLAARVAAKRLLGATCRGWSQLRAQNEACKPGIRLGSRHIADLTWSPKRYYPCPLKTDLLLKNFFFNSLNLLAIALIVNVDSGPAYCNLEKSVPLLWTSSYRLIIFCHTWLKNWLAAGLGRCYYTGYTKIAKTL